MKTKGKIVQIIKEEEVRKYGFPQIPNHDYLNIAPQNIPKKNCSLWVLLLFTVGIAASYFIGKFFKNLFNSSVMGQITSIIVYFIPAATIFYFWRKQDKEFKKRPLWLFDKPIQIEKPHDYKIGDIVEIELNLKKVEDAK